VRHGLAEMNCGKNLSSDRIEGAGRTALENWQDGVE
jgi:hypothetical protein